ncbi:MAG: ral stress protein [Burkholderiales bacterium]|jgi:general stress protein 26|nr:ral stress protein [Burkholderiales bacterium]MCE3268955.1 ral stress protein [Burkholderiales bacterium]
MEEKQAITKLNELIKPIKICMLTTAQENGELHARPMAKLEEDFNGKFLFFTNIDSPKVYEIRDDAQVNVAFSEPKENTYVSCNGVAKIIKDRIKIQELWSPMCKVWFPKGVEDPNLVIIEVTVTNAEYWDSPSSSFLKIVGFAQALLTGNKAALGDHKKVNI